MEGGAIDNHLRAVDPYQRTHRPHATVALHLGLMEDAAAKLVVDPLGLRGRCEVVLKNSIGPQKPAEHRFRAAVCVS